MNTHRRHPCMRCSTHCDRGRKKVLQICIISEKKAQPHEVYQNIFLEISIPFDFHPGISRTFGLMVCFSQNSTISRFSGTCPRKFLYHLSLFRKFCSNGKLLISVCLTQRLPEARYHPYQMNEWLENTAVSTKVVRQKCKSVRDNADYIIMGTKSSALLH